MRSMVHIEWSRIASHFLAKAKTVSGLVNGAGLTKARPMFAMYALPFCLLKASKIDQSYAPFQDLTSEIYRIKPKLWRIRKWKLPHSNCEHRISPADAAIFPWQRPNTCR